MHRAFLVALAAALVLAGCGSAGSAPSKRVSVTITRDFGAKRLAYAAAAGPANGETVLSFTRRHSGLRPGPGWSSFVNGIATRGTADLNPGDRVWWDRHPGHVHVRAVVGSFPEPFRSGSGGARFPVRIECAQVGGPACTLTRDRMRATVPDTAVAEVGGTAGKDVLRILVGPWRVIREDPALQQIQRGPGASGVYVRPSPAANSIAVLDPAGATTKKLGPGQGLIAATRLGDQQPTWAVTGVDEAGAKAAAAALTEQALKNRFAAAVQGKTVLSVP